MTDLTTLEMGQHVAVLDVFAGNGLLVMPLERHDVVVNVDELALSSISEDDRRAVASRLDVDPAQVRGAPQSPSLNHADMLAAVGRLDALGWERVEGDDGAMMVEGATDTGRTLVALRGRDPIHTTDDLGESGRSWNRLFAAASLL